MLIAAAQIRPKKADYAENVRRIGAVLAQVSGWKEPPRLIAFGETVTSGYYLEGGVLQCAVTAGTLYRDLAAQHALVGAKPLDVVVGFYERYENRIFNSALHASLGGKTAGIRHVHRKIFLPTYGVFDEQRFADSGHSVEAFDTDWGRVAMLVCEDAWHSVTGTVAALGGARLIVVPSASPARGPVPGSGVPKSSESWERVIRRIAEEHGAYVILAQISGTEAGKTFQGCSLIVGPDGNVLARAPAFDEAIISAQFDERAIDRARFDQPMLADLESALPGLLAGPDRRGNPEAQFDAADGAAPKGPAPVSRNITVLEQSDPLDPLAIDPELLTEWLVRFLRDEVTERRGFTKAVVGLSGGVDSAVTAALAVRALGAGNVLGLSMPYRTSAKASGTDAALVARTLGIRLETVDISAAVDGLIAAADPKADPTRRGNVMARMRMTVLFDRSARDKSIPLGTGNKTERLFGYFTWHGDDAPPVNPIGDLFKTQIWALARHLGIPDTVIAKPATADLVVGQTDEGDLGIAYVKADPILHFMLKGFTDAEIAAKGFTKKEVSLVRTRLDATHWKRRTPTVAMVSYTAIGESYLRPVDY